MKRKKIWGFSIGWKGVVHVADCPNLSAKGKYWAVSTTNTFELAYLLDSTLAYQKKNLLDSTLSQTIDGFNKQELHKTLCIISVISSKYHENREGFLKVKMKKNSLLLTIRLIHIKVTEIMWFCMELFWNHIS